jgi:sortase (surface protein transpeptidase)
LFGHYPKARVAYTKAKALAELPGYNVSQRPNLPIRVIIPSVKINQLINPAQIVDGNWQTFYSGVSYLTNSARPGENSNIVIYGHNTNTVLGSSN